MRCRCGANLVHITSAGEPMVRNKGMVFKAEGIALICPKCGADVPVSGDMAKAMQERIVVFLRRPAPAS
jgi:hypothetical protein